MKFNVKKTKYNHKISKNVLLEYEDNSVNKNFGYMNFWTIMLKQMIHKKSLMIYSTADVSSEL